MGLTSEDLKGEMSPEEYQSRKEWIDRTRSNDEWNCKIFKKLGILITSHQSNRPYLKACIESHKKLGYWMAVCYDNYVNPEWDEIDHNKFMPAKDVMNDVDLFIMGHHQVWGGVLYPYFWELKWGASALQDFEYIYCVNGDFILEKPEGFEELFAELLDSDADVMTSGPDYLDKPAANTAGFIIRTPAFLNVVKHMQDHLVPWDVYEKYTQEIGNMEGRFGAAIRDLNLRVHTVEPPIGADGRPDDMFRHHPSKRKQTGTWYDLIGFRHIHSEHNFAYRSRGIPPEPKYLDERFLGDEYRIIKEYWEKKDEKVLEDWWASDS